MAVQAARPQQARKLSLSGACKVALINNKQIEKALVEKDIAEEEISEQKELKLPDVDVHTSYARITNLTEFNNGRKELTKTIPDISDFGAQAKMTLYAGGRLGLAVTKARQEYAVASLKTGKVANDVQVEVAAHFLGIYKLLELQKLVAENIKEEEARLKEVQSFKAHGTVTKNEVLRAELLLSNRQLQYMHNQKNIEAAFNEFKTLLQLPEEDSVMIDTAGILNTPVVVNGFQAYLQAAYQKEEMLIAQKQEDIKNTERRMVKGSIYPVVNVFTGWGFNYPNYLFFPPAPNWYTLGKIGVEASFSLTGLYKNKTRLRIADKKIEAQQAGTEILKNAIKDNVFKQYKQYEEVEETLPVAEKAEQQAAENYRIIKTKYLNQLALITDMVDADNALLEARFNRVSARIDLLMKYYELQYASGTLNLY